METTAIFAPETVAGSCALSPVQESNGAPGSIIRNRISAELQTVGVMAV
ncbi:hypothetical protein QUW02_09690 [Bacteroides eggerthii]|uniref:Uncharacterized protein n=1 Tax=Bacteroides eggerthii TaxID=28111 RepID=A0ABT7U6N8_9BACE|nr:hypothetical protein [Bacteroides eggerthii]